MIGTYVCSSVSHEIPQWGNPLSVQCLIVPPDLLRDVRQLDEQLVRFDGTLRVLPAQELAGVPWQTLRCWCHVRGVYGLPTTELVDYVHDLIGDRTAIEIGAGNGALGRALDIPRTDSRLQEHVLIAKAYAAAGQPTVQYGRDVEKLDALSAAQKYRPAVVVGSWITQRWRPGDGAGSQFGVDEAALLEQVDCYILQGSLTAHNPENKRIRSRPHRVVREPWILGRAAPGNNVLFVWGE